MKLQNFNKKKMFQAKYFNIHIYQFAEYLYNTSVGAIPFHSNLFHSIPIYLACIHSLCK